jgi:hypothetical protein
VIVQILLYHIGTFEESSETDNQILLNLNHCCCFRPSRFKLTSYQPFLQPIHVLTILSIPIIVHSSLFHEYQKSDFIEIIYRFQENYEQLCFEGNLGSINQRKIVITVLTLPLRSPFGECIRLARVAVVTRRLRPLHIVSVNVKRLCTRLTNLKSINSWGIATLAQASFRHTNTTKLSYPPTTTSTLLDSRQ